MNTETDTTPDRTAKAIIFREQFTGEIIDEGHDGTHVYYVRDRAGRTRAVRPDHPHHHLELLDEAAGCELGVQI